MLASAPGGYKLDLAYGFEWLLHTCRTHAQVTAPSPLIREMTDRKASIHPCYEVEHNDCNCNIANLYRLWLMRVGSTRALILPGARNAVYMHGRDRRIADHVAGGRSASLYPNHQWQVAVKPFHVPGVPPKWAAPVMVPRSLIPFTETLSAPEIFTCLTAPFEK